MDREQLKNKFKKVIEKIEHDGDTYYVRSLPASVKLKLYQEKNDLPDTAQGVLMVNRSLCDENGKRLLTDDDLDTVETFPLELIGELVQATQRACGVTVEKYDEAKKN